MKKSSRARSPKLLVSVEKVRELDARQIEQVAGGTQGWKIDNDAHIEPKCPGGSCFHSKPG
jgi:hypothetical protein